jgi:hypothetical protein
VHCEALIAQPIPQSCARSRLPAHYARSISPNDASPSALGGGEACVHRGVQATVGPGAAPGVARAVIPPGY